MAWSCSFVRPDIFFASTHLKPAGDDLFDPSQERDPAGSTLPKENTPLSYKGYPLSKNLILHSWISIRNLARRNTNLVTADP